MKRKIDYIIVHCSATQAKSDIGATEIDRMHRARGFWGCGYHYIIRRNGLIESASAGNRCRPLDRAGAHVGNCGAGWNKRSIGICLVGGIDSKGNAENNFTEEQFKSLKELLDYLNCTFPKCTIMGHRDLIKLTHSAPKDCPCFEVKDFLKENGL